MAVCALDEQCKTRSDHDTDHTAGRSACLGVNSRSQTTTVYPSVTDVSGDPSFE